jgi:hypothetical protein
LKAGSCCHRRSPLLKNCGLWLRRSVTAGVKRSTMHLIWCRIVDGDLWKRLILRAMARISVAASEVSLQPMHG